MSDNLRGGLLMVLAMAGFAIEDMFIKMLAGTMPVGQILALIGLGGAPVFAVIARIQGRAMIEPALLTGPVMLRNMTEIIGTMGFVLAIALTPLSSASAILQATPLAVTLGAALFLGATVGWRRWIAILVGFGGVLLIVRPGAAAFDPASLFAIVGVLGLAARDLATRRVPAATSSVQLSAWGFAMIIPAGVLLMIAMGEAPILPDAAQAAKLAGAISIGVLGYGALVMSMRLGEIAFVTCFRYSRLLFALVIGIAVFGERPDALTYLGATVIVGAGLFTLWRETRRPFPSIKLGL